MTHDDNVRQAKTAEDCEMAHCKSARAPIPQASAMRLDASKAVLALILQCCMRSTYFANQNEHATSQWSLEGTESEGEQHTRGGTRGRARTKDVDVR